MKSQVRPALCFRYVQVPVRPAEGDGNVAQVGTRTVAALGAMGLLLATVAGVIVEFHTPTGETSKELLAQYSRDALFDGSYVVAVMMETIGFLLLALFLIHFAAQLWRRSDGLEWVETAVVAGVVVATTLTFVAIAAPAASRFRTSHGGLGVDSYAVLQDVATMVYWVSLPAWSVILVAFGLELIRRRVDRPLAWAGVTVGAAQAVAMALPAGAWDPITGLAGLWMLAAAALLVLRPGRYSQLPA